MTEERAVHQRTVRMSGDGGVGLLAGASFATLLMFGILFISFYLA